MEEYDVVCHDCDAPATRVQFIRCAVYERRLVTPGFEPEDADSETQLSPNSREDYHDEVYLCETCQADSGRDMDVTFWLVVGPRHVTAVRLPSTSTPDAIRGKAMSQAEILCDRPGETPYAFRQACLRAKIVIYPDGR